MSKIILIAGLGNPGAKYKKTRHNIGFDVVDMLASSLNCPLSSSKGFEVAKTRSADQQTFLLKPMQYMNESGRAVRHIADYYNIEYKDIVVIHDEIDLEPGIIKIKFGGGSAGHKGINSCSSYLGTKDFWRVRIGCGRPARVNDCSVSDYVLSNPSKLELELITESRIKAEHLLLDLIKGQEMEDLTKVDLNKK